MQLQTGESFLSVPTMVDQLTGKKLRKDFLCHWKNGGRDMVKVDKQKCLYCGGCVGLCPANALTLMETSLVISDACINCGICIKFCPVGALGE